MGMAASQARLCGLTLRKHDIGRKLQHLSLEKMALTRDSQKISKEYTEALSAKTLKWSNNAGVNYVDLTYNTLMKPNSFNNRAPYLLTNQNGRIVLDSKYAEYARMISPNGAPGGDWESNRTEILSKLTGVSTESIEMSSTTSAAVDSASKAKTDAKKKMDDAYNKAVETYSAKKLAALWGTVGNIDFSKSGSKVELGDKNAAISVLNNVKNQLTSKMQGKFCDEKDQKEFEESLAVIDGTISALQASREDGVNSGVLSQKDGKYTLDVDALIKQILGAYGGRTTSSNDETKYVLKKDDAAWSEYVSAKSEYEQLSKEYTDAVHEDNTVFDAPQASQIAYYDALFEAIVDKGWSEDSQVEDGNYLGQMLQNNFYNITTMERNSLYEEDAYESSKQNKYNYETDLASNFDKIFQVNDENVRQEAQANYENKKLIINAKESKIDTMMKNLETEQSAISKMIEGIEQVKKDNIEAHFNLWS